MIDNRVPHHGECVRCAKPVVLLLDPKDVEEWKRGGPRSIQTIFHYLTPAERELLQSGLCGDCWNAVFPPEPEESRGEPVDWQDLPTWVKGAADRGDAELAFAKGLKWYRLEENSYVAYNGDEFVDLYEKE